MVGHYITGVTTIFNTLLTFAGLVVSFLVFRQNRRLARRQAADSEPPKEDEKRQIRKVLAMLKSTEWLMEDQIEILL
ncbi:uncharacterized protein TrAFT101_011724 [Trichoderma asperellum]|uniref:uncharacterized protein n=1 Tax=Trichoderma asperellum TaxID=101201 RepID=UPI0033333206|nr:hypothetical protein TrAFT101_011724 [Trichoderma asperellum]